MSKLEELITPTQLLSIIKEGAVKQELAKKYRASDQDLAMMLLPLYRRGDLTKEEFNDFFRGGSLGKTGIGNGSEVARPKAEDEPPSEILKSLTKIFSKKSSEAKQDVAEQAPPAAVAVEAEEAPPAVSEAVSETAAQAVTETAVDRSANESSPVSFESVSSSATDAPPVSEAADTPEDYAQEVSKGMDSAGFASLLNSIFSRLNSIDKRLAAIEKKVQG